MNGSRGRVNFADENLRYCGNKKFLIEGKVNRLGFKLFNNWGVSPISLSYIVYHKKMLGWVFSGDDLNYHIGSTTRLFNTHHLKLCFYRHFNQSFIFGNLNEGANTSVRIHHRGL